MYFNYFYFGNKKEFRLFFFLWMLLTSFSGKSQSPDKNFAWKNYIENIYESESSKNMDELYEYLSFRSEHPFNLRTLTRKELESLPFLSPVQVEDLISYLYFNSPLKTIYELKNIKNLDRETIDRLLPFLYLGKELPEKLKMKNILKDSKNEIMTRSDYCLQEKSGFAVAKNNGLKGNEGKAYVGERPYLLFKYKSNYKDKYFFNLTAEKDPGEAFLNRVHKGFDFYSANLTMDGLSQGLNRLSIGDYKVSIGEGLVLNNSFSLGKSGLMNGTSVDRQTIRPYSSSNEFYFFRGIASSVHINDHFEGNLFFSTRNLDANADNKQIYSFKTDGYHRTANEIKKESQATIHTVGGDINYTKGKYYADFTFVYYRFGGKSLNPQYHDYNKYYLRGKDNFNTSLNYGMRTKRFFLHGETAVSKNRSAASLNTLNLYLFSGTEWMLSYRNYSKSYNSFYSNVLCESSDPRNEEGFLSGFKTDMLHGCEIETYVDLFKFPYMKYGINQPSSGIEVSGSVSSAIKGNNALSFHYLYKHKYKNITGSKSNEIFAYDKHSIKGNLKNDFLKRIQNKVSFYFNRYYGPKGRQTTGWALTEDFKIRILKENVISGSFAWFNCKDWNNAIYAYENSVYQDFCFNTFYGAGLRYCILSKINFGKNWIFYLKSSTTKFFDKKKIGSGTEEISGDKKTDINCVVRIKF